MIDYAGNKIAVDGCLGCAYAKHEFSLPTGIEYEDELFTLSQDWELPIQGFFVVAPKHHVEKFSELTNIERTKIFEIVDYAIKILRENKVCDSFNVIFEEKLGRHFHIWIMPRHEWMKNLVGDITDHIGTIFDYAKKNLKTKENLKEIENISKTLKTAFLDFKFSVQ